MLDVACPTPIHFGFLDAFSNCIVGINSWITDTSTKDKGKRDGRGWEFQLYIHYTIFGYDTTVNMVET